MILQSLYELYQRIKDDPAYDIPPQGYSLQRVSFKVVLRKDGSLFDIQDVRIEGRPRQIRVLGVTKQSGSGFNPCFLWDNTAYMLGFKAKDDDPKRTNSEFEHFRSYHLSLEKEIDSDLFSKVCRFLESWTPERAKDFPILMDVSTGFGVFQISGEPGYVHQDQKIDSWWQGHWQQQQAGQEGETIKGQCSITGNWGPIARLHPMTKGVSGGKAQVALVSFNEQAYESYGKDQAFNSPATVEAAFEYGSALNALLDGPMKTKHRLRIGDATVVFWTGQPSFVEDVFAPFLQNEFELSSAEPVQDEATRQKLEMFLRALRIGVEKCQDIGRDERNNNFYLLALSPNAARLSVRYFYRGTIQEMLDNLRKHFLDMSIERRFGEESRRPEPEFPSIWMLLNQTARKSEDIPPVLAGPLLRAILTGLPYPDGLFQSVIRRIRADRTINYFRACIIKAWLVRNRKKEVTMSLDYEKRDPAYRIGRLFAALEKTQADALGQVGSNIRDRFYSAASATPQSVFPRLLRTYQHHLSKLETGIKINREKLVQEIVESLHEFPAHLNLADQGMFALGYYHQMQAFFQRQGQKNKETSKDIKSNEEES